MQKKDIPKPKYNLAETVVVQLPQGKAVLEIDEINITLTKSGTKVNYTNLGPDEQITFEEVNVVKRINLN